MVKNPPANAGDIQNTHSVPGLGRSPGGGHLHSSILGWRICLDREPGRLWSIGLQRVGHDWSELACMHTAEYLSAWLAYKQQRLFFFFPIALEAQKSKIEALTNQLSIRWRPNWFLGGHLLAVSSYGERGWRNSWSLFYKSMSPIYGDSAFMT